MGSAHHFTKANIWSKVKKYLSKGSGDMEWTWNARLKLVTFNCDLDLESACFSYGFAHRLTKANIWSTFHEHHSKGSGDMARTRNRRMTFSCDLDLESDLESASLSYRFILLRRTFDPNFKIQGSNWWPSIVTLTLSQHSWVMGSAHYLTEANIWPTNF